MKIELTKTQLLDILSKHFNTSVNDVVISGSPIADILYSELCGFNPETDKLSAIKHLRQLIVDKGWSTNMMNLVDAKWAVENLSRFIAFVRTNDRLPKVGFSNGELK